MGVGMLPETFGLNLSFVGDDDDFVDVLLLFGDEDSEQDDENDVEFVRARLGPPP